MKISVLFTAGVFGQQPQIDCEANPQLCAQLGQQFPNGQLPEPGLEIPASEPELEDFDGARCAKNSWNNETPKPASGNYCPAYSCNSCCDDDKFIAQLGSKGDAESTLQYGPYRFEGGMSKSCHSFVVTSHCVKSCDPNSYIHFPSGSDQVTGAAQIPVCDDFCRDFYNACKDDTICYKKDGITELLKDVSAGTFDPEAKEYEIFSCVGEHTNEKLSDTVFAGSGMLYELDGNLKEALRLALKKWAEENGVPTQEDYQIFCERFSTKLFKPVQNDQAFCIDPRSPSDMAGAVTQYEQNYNEENPKDQRNFPVTETCSTGLSGGAIAGIVIGCIAGVALIGVGVYFLFFNKTSEDSKGKYEVTQQDEKEMNIVRQSFKQTEDNPVQPSQSVKSDYDPAERSVNNSD